MSAHGKKIYVQIDIDCPIDELWRLTQTPGLHQKWDLRFDEIDYLPRDNDSQPQRFVYATRIGFGFNIRGEGESVGTFDSPEGERSSALRFWSHDPKSLIREGSGYWKYIPLGTDGGTIRFVTLYDYGVNFKLPGRILDRLIFRPLIGWATAWSFDRLRLWIERDIDPAASMRHSIIYLICRVALAFVWLYQGMVPKLISKHLDELALLEAVGVPHSAARGVCIAAGCAEVAVGLTLLLAWRFAGPLWLTLVMMPIAFLAVAFPSPAFLSTPFNPATLNLSVFALAVVCLMITGDVPSARHCVRRQPGNKT